MWLLRSQLGWSCCRSSWEVAAGAASRREQLPPRVGRWALKRHCVLAGPAAWQVLPRADTSPERSRERGTQDHASRRPCGETGSVKAS